MKRIGQMNQFVESAKEESGQKSDLDSTSVLQKA